MKAIENVVGAIAVTVALAGCDLAALGNQLTSSNLTVVTLLATPPVELRPLAVAGIDASIPLGDAGVDAGALLADAGFTVPGQTIAFVFFGQKQGDGLTAPPMGITGAAVSATQAGTKHTIPELGGGTYQLLGSDGGLSYASGATYDFTIVHQTKTYGARLENAPAQETIPELHPAPGFVDLARNTALTLTRPAPAQGERNLAFVTVFPINRDRSKAQPTFTNVPMDPLGFLKLVAAPAEWKAATVTIPGSAFPDADKNYLVVLQSAKLGKTTTDNLFPASAILGGTADVGIVKTRP